MSSSNVSPLIYPSLSGVDLSVYTNVLLIDSVVQDYQTFVTSSNAQTFPVVYSSNSSRDELLALLTSAGFSNLSRLALVFETNDNGRVYPFLNGEVLFTDSDSNGVTPFSENMSFVVSLIQTLGITNFDFLACSTLLFSNWKNYYAVLLAQTGVTVGASDDKSGNIKYGGDWVLESTDQDVESLYFTSGIEYYQYLLASAYNYQVNVTDTATYTNSTNYTGGTNTVIFDIIGNVTSTFTNTGIVLGGGGAARTGGAGFGWDGAHAIIVETGKTVNAIVNTGFLTGGGGGGACGANSGFAGRGGAGGGGGGGADLNYVGGIGGNSPNGNGANGSAGNNGGGGGGGGGFGGIRGVSTGSGALIMIGGNGATVANIFGTSGGSFGSYPGGGGGGAGGGNGGNNYGAGGSGGGAGKGGAGNGGVGIKNNGTITTLSNSQNLSMGYGPLYIGGNAPTNYNIIIQGDTSYGQLFASPNTGLGVTGNVVFGIDPTSVLSTGTKIYTNVLSKVTPSNLSGTLTANSLNYNWSLSRNAVTTDNNNLSVVNYDLSLASVPVPVTKAACVLEGTEVWTDKGMVAIENLKVGDSICTRHYEIAVTKIGKWTIDLNTEQDRDDLSKKMYKIAAGKYGAERDVYISHYHRVLVDENPESEEESRVFRLPTSLGLPVADPREYSKDGKYTLYHLQLAVGNHYVVNGDCMVESWKSSDKYF